MKGEKLAINIKSSRSWRISTNIMKIGFFFIIVIGLILHIISWFSDSIYAALFSSTGWIIDIIGIIIVGIGSILTSYVYRAKRKEFIEGKKNSEIEKFLYAKKARPKETQKISTEVAVNNVRIVQSSRINPQINENIQDVKEILHSIKSDEKKASKEEGSLLDKYQICPNCNEKNNSAVLFCKNCGRYMDND